ncbi:MAG: UbiX family flavin prenyltransferase [Firmicutes bacterium]|nr:UbiX family flavin prenyltransferase [Bacillota bacterium]
MTKIVLAISGASGAIYGIRILDALKDAGVETHLIVSDAARKTIGMETSYTIEEVITKADYNYQNGDIGATPASGSFLHQGMVVAPCSMKTLSAIAHGYDDNLIARAASVTIKERRRLLLLVRETPLSPIHLENMLRLARLGVVIAPPVPAFYHHPQSIEDIVRQTTGRVMDLLGMENNLVKRWSGGGGGDGSGQTAGRQAPKT